MPQFWVSDHGSFGHRNVNFGKQLPAVEFVAGQRFATAEEQAVGADSGLPIAEAQFSSFGPEGQDVCHRLPGAGRILQGFTKQHQATAFGDQGQTLVNGCR